MTSNVRGSSAPATPKPRPESAQPATFTRNSCLKILLTNAFGLLSKFSEFEHTLNKTKADIGIVTETKLTIEKMTLAESSIPGLHQPYA